MILNMDQAFGEQVGHRLKSVREGLGLSQRDLAERLGVIGQSAISKWERGKIPDAATIAALEELLGLPPGALTIDRWEDREPTIEDVRDVVLRAELSDTERRSLLALVDLISSSRRRGRGLQDRSLSAASGEPDVDEDQP